MEAKCLQWCIYNNKLGSVKDKLTSQQQAINGIQQQLVALKEEGNKIQAARSSSALQLQRVRQQMQGQSQLEANLEQEIHTLNTKINNLMSELSISKEIMAASSQKTTAQDMRSQLEALDSQIQKLAPLVQAHEAQLTQMKNDYSQTESRYKILMSKNTRKFKSIQERNQFINDNIDSLQKQIATKQQDHSQLQSKVTQIEQSKQQLLASVSAIKQELTETRAAQSGLEFELNTSKSSLKQLREESVQKMFRYNQNTQALEDLRIKSQDAERSIEGLLKDSTLVTVRQIQNLARERGIEGVFGLLLEHVRIPDHLNKTIDHVLKKKLFSLIVADESVAEKVIQINREIQGATLEIYPLDWVEGMNIEEELAGRSYPES